MNAVNNQIQQQPEKIQEVPMPKAKRGRPRGRKNLSDFGPAGGGWEEGAKIGSRPKSIIPQKKWQRDWVVPQFVLSRRQVQDMLLKYLRSKPGKAALMQVIQDGFMGLSKMTDEKLCEFIVSTNLLSRYPHQIVIRGA